VLGRARLNPPVFCGQRDDSHHVLTGAMLLLLLLLTRTSAVSHILALSRRAAAQVGQDQIKTLSSEQ